MGRLVNEVVESLVNHNFSGVGQIRMADFRAQMRLRARWGAIQRAATDAGSNGRLSRSETRSGRIADQAGRGAAGASGARMLGGSLETEKRSCRATSIALIE